MKRVAFCIFAVYVICMSLLLLTWTHSSLLRSSGKGSFWGGTGEDLLTIASILQDSKARLGGRFRRRRRQDAVGNPLDSINFNPEEADLEMSTEEGVDDDDNAGEDADEDLDTEMDRRQQPPNKNRLVQPTKPKYPPYAYSFVLGGCDPDYPNYQAYLYGIFVQAHILRMLGSKSDMYLFLELHHNSNHTSLPEKELRVLRGLRITIINLPRMKVPTFYQLQLQKFRALGLTQYRRVFHLDTDILPLANLDYLMEHTDPLSDEWKKNGFNAPPLQEQFVITSPNDPSNGGHFILTPKPGDLEAINKIIQEKEKNFVKGIQFSRKYGWGADIGMWNATNMYGIGWNFLAAGGDQGLLYYWTKYYKQKVSVHCELDRLETWIPGPNNMPKLLREEKWPIPSYNQIHSWGTKRKGVRMDYVHFMGPKAKPWNHVIYDLSEKTKMKKQFYFWQYCLWEIDQQYNLGIDFYNLNRTKAVPYVLVRRNFTSESEYTNLLVLG